MYRDDNILTLYLLIPGINSKSISIEIHENELSISAKFTKVGKLLYRKGGLVIKGQVHYDIYNKTVRTVYKDGIIEILLSIKKV